MADAAVLILMFCVVCERRLTTRPSSPRRSWHAAAPASPPRRTRATSSGEDIGYCDAEVRCSGTLKWTRSIVLTSECVVCRAICGAVRPVRRGSVQRCESAAKLRGGAVAGFETDRNGNPIKLECKEKGGRLMHWCVVAHAPAPARHSARTHRQAKKCLILFFSLLFCFVFFFLVLQTTIHGRRMAAQGDGAGALGRLQDVGGRRSVANNAVHAGQAAHGLAARDQGAPGVSGPCSERGGLRARARGH